MDCSDYILSDNYYFKFGISTLLTTALINNGLYVIDCDKSDIIYVMRSLDLSERHIIAFISNDIEYYIFSALNDHASIKFIDKKSKVSQILSCVFLKASPYEYRVKYILSKRELELLLCMQKGYSVEEISKKLDVKIKAIYTHRRNLVNKLRLRNRIALYHKISSVIDIAR